jgi:hypothetical protein
VQLSGQSFKELSHGDTLRSCAGSNCYASIIESGTVVTAPVRDMDSKDSVGSVGSGPQQLGATEAIMPR